MFLSFSCVFCRFFFFQAEDGIRALLVTGVQTCALPISTTGRLAGATPFSYAAGTMSIVRDENISANLLIGDFGPEVALITDASTRAGSPAIGGTDDPAAQAVLYAAAQEPLIGEEVFAAPAYLGGNPAHAASLVLQDILRWLL